MEIKQRHVAKAYQYTHLLSYQHHCVGDDQILENLRKILQRECAFYNKTIIIDIQYQVHAQEAQGGESHFTFQQGQGITNDPINCSQNECLSDYRLLGNEYQGTDTHKANLHWTKWTLLYGNKHDIKKYQHDCGQHLVLIDKFDFL